MPPITKSRSSIAEYDKNPVNLHYIGANSVTYATNPANYDMGRAKSIHSSTYLSCI